MAKEQEEIINSIEGADKQKVDVPKQLTIIPLRDIVIYPNMIFPILIGRTSSLKAVADAVDRDKFVFVVAQKNPNTEEPTFEDIYKHGTIAKIIQVLRLPNNLLKVLVEGLFQAVIEEEIDNKTYLEANVKQIPIKYNEKDKELIGLQRHASILFKEYIQSNAQLPPDIIGAYENINDPLKKLYYASANINTKPEKKQEILEQKKH